MKTTLFLAGMLLVSSASAQLADTAGDFQAAPGTRPKDAFDRFFSPVRPAEVQRGRVTYTGVFVQSFKMKNPLQLINPFAPASVGDAEANIARDSITRRASGIKLFSATF